MVSRCSLESKWHVYLGERTYILAVQRWRQGSDSKDGGEKTFVELRNQSVLMAVLLGGRLMIAFTY